MINRLRFEYFILTMFLLLAGTSISLGQIRMSVGDVTVDYGDTVMVPIIADSSLTGEGVVSYQLRIQYTSSRLNFLGFETAGTISNAYGTPFFSDDGTYITAAAAGVSPLSGSGDFIYAVFEVISTSGSSVYLSGAAYNFFNEGNPPLVIGDYGYVSVIPPPTIYVYPSNPILYRGQNRQFSASGGTAPYSYGQDNPSVGTLTSSGQFTATFIGTTTVTATDTFGYTGSSNVEVRGMKIYVEDTLIQQGQPVCIPVRTTDLNGLNIVSGEIRLTYNINSLSFLGVDFSGTMLQGVGSTAVDTSVSGQVEIAFANSTALSDSGVLFYLCFDPVLNNTASYLTFTNVLFNQNLLAVTTNGYISKVNLPTIYVSPNSISLVAGETQTFSASGGTAPYSWSVSDTSLASFGLFGLMTAKSGGTVTVTATDQIGAMGSSSTITIYDTRIWGTDMQAVLDTILFPVYMSDLPAAKDFTAFQGTFAFDDTKLVANRIVTDGSLCDGYFINGTATGNKFSYAAAGIDPITGPGVLFYIEFIPTVSFLVGQTAYVRQESIVLNQGDPVALLNTTNELITAVTCIQPTVSFSIEKACAGDTVILNNNTTDTLPGVTFYWDFENDGVFDLVTSAGEQGKVFYPSVTYRTVKLKAVNTITCPDSAFLSFTQSSLYVNAYGTDPSTPYASDGSVGVSVFSGVSPYSYYWNTIPPSNTSTLSGLPGGLYAVTVTDGYNCEASDSIVIVNGVCDSSTLIGTTNITPTSAKLNWVAVSGAAKYEIRGWKVGNSTPAIFIVDGTATDEKVVGLKPTTLYAWQIRTWCDTAGLLKSGWTRIDTFATNCYAPDSIATTNISTNSATLLWTGVSGGHDGFQIRGRKVGGVWVDILVNNPSATSRNVSGLEPSTLYEWRIRTICSDFFGVYSSYTALTNFNTAALRLAETPSGLDLKAFPNPSDGPVQVWFNVNEEMKNLHLEVLDATGRLLESAEFNDLQGSYSYTLDYPDYRGLLLIRLISEQNEESIRVLLH